MPPMGAQPLEPKPGVDEVVGQSLAPPDPNDPNAQQPVATDPASLPGVEVQHFAFRLGGQDGKPVGLMRVADDDDAEVLTLERFTPEGEWEDDPALIEDLRQPGVYACEPDEAESIKAQILGHQA